jgi:hypothetical protein
MNHSYIFRLSQRSLRQAVQNEESLNYLREFNVHRSVYRNNILIYIQQDATLHSLFYLETAVHVSGGTFTHHQ